MDNRRSTLVSLGLVACFALLAASACSPAAAPGEPSATATTTEQVPDAPQQRLREIAMGWGLSIDSDIDTEEIGSGTLYVVAVTGHDAMGLDWIPAGAEPIALVSLPDTRTRSAQPVAADYYVIAVTEERRAYLIGEGGLIAAETDVEPVDVPHPPSAAQRTARWVFGLSTITAIPDRIDGPMGCVIIVDASGIGRMICF